MFINLYTLSGFPLLLKCKTVNIFNITLNEPRREKIVFFCICENKDADQLRSKSTMKELLIIEVVVPKISFHSWIEDD